jgi:hypothetical protein
MPFTDQYLKSLPCKSATVRKSLLNFLCFQQLSRQVRVYVGSDGGPPPFTPFGQKLRTTKPTSVRKGGFQVSVLSPSAFNMILQHVVRNIVPFLT